MRSIPKDQGLRGVFITGYKPYYPEPRPLGDFKSLMLKRDLDLDKFASLPLGSSALREYDQDLHFRIGLNSEDLKLVDERDTPKVPSAYSAFGAVIAAALTNEEEVTNLPFFKSKSELSIDYKFRSNEVAISRLEALDRSGDHYTARNEIAKFLIKSDLLNIKEDELDKAIALGIVDELEAPEEEKFDWE